MYGPTSPLWAELSRNLEAEYRKSGVCLLDFEWSIVCYANLVSAVKRLFMQSVLNFSCAQ